MNLYVYTTNFDILDLQLGMERLIWARMSDGVTVAQGPLEAFVMVRIHVGQPISRSFVLPARTIGATIGKTSDDNPTTSRAASRTSLFPCNLEP